MAHQFICDRCRKVIDGPRVELVAAGYRGNDRSQEETFDLCLGCASQLHDFLSGKAVDRVRDV